MMARKEEIEAAVAAYDAANPLTPLQRNAARLLIAMFPTGGICQRKPDEIATSGFSQGSLPRTLERLARAGFLSFQRGPGQRGAGAATYQLHIPPVRR
jgi:hypothetical protein